MDLTPTPQIALKGSKSKKKIAPIVAELKTKDGAVVSHNQSCNSSLFQSQLYRVCQSKNLAKDVYRIQVYTRQTSFIFLHCNILANNKLQSCFLSCKQYFVFLIIYLCYFILQWNILLFSLLQMLMLGLAIQVCIS